MVGRIRPAGVPAGSAVAGLRCSLSVFQARFFSLGFTPGRHPLQCPRLGKPQFGPQIPSEVARFNLVPHLLLKTKLLTLFLAIASLLPGAALAQSESDTVVLDGGNISTSNPPELGGHQE